MSKTTHQIKTLFQTAFTNIHSIAFTMVTELVNKRLAVNHTVSNKMIGYFHCRAGLPVSQLCHLCFRNGCNTFLREEFLSDEMCAE